MTTPWPNPRRRSALCPTDVLFQPRLNCQPQSRPNATIPFLLHTNEFIVATFIDHRPTPGAAARIIAKMPARIGSGRVGQADTTATKSGSSSVGPVGKGWERRSLGEW
jgi:hypothetical protein